MNNHDNCLKEFYKGNYTNYFMVKGKKIPMSEETAKNLLEAQKAEEPIILVPDNIQFKKSVNSFSMGLRFGNNQELYWNYFNETWMVAKFSCLIKTKLVSCKYEDLEVGDWYYGHSYNGCIGKTKEQYRLVGNNEDWFINDNKQVINGLKGRWAYYWKVVEIGEYKYER